MGFANIKQQTEQMLNSQMCRNLLLDEDKDTISREDINVNTDLQDDNQRNKQHFISHSQSRQHEPAMDIPCVSLAQLPAFQCIIAVNSRTAIRQMIINILLLSLQQYTEKWECKIRFSQISDHVLCMNKGRVVSVVMMIILFVFSILFIVAAFFKRHYEADQLILSERFSPAKFAVLVFNEPAFANFCVLFGGASVILVLVQVIK
ncbi:MAG: hypothetical protein EZS28_009826 [Streblomastix strix]|uniref:Uncharacterized protein n=1 Tax=Streblomastix strix TaxID=222440 RepID=A0A5J4WI48_9EUKA|nr:MAG: hypothetical protein EZS28_009826 [Streblomastix strix]